MQKLCHIIKTRFVSNVDANENANLTMIKMIKCFRCFQLNYNNTTFNTHTPLSQTRYSFCQTPNNRVKVGNDIGVKKRLKRFNSYKKIN